MWCYQTCLTFLYVSAKYIHQYGIRWKLVTLQLRTFDETVCVKFAVKNSEAILVLMGQSPERKKMITLSIKCLNSATLR